MARMIKQTNHFFILGWKKASDCLRKKLPFTSTISNYRFYWETKIMKVLMPPLRSQIRFYLDKLIGGKILKDYAFRAVSFSKPQSLCHLWLTNFCCWLIISDYWPIKAVSSYLKNFKFGTYDTPKLSLCFWENWLLWAWNWIDVALVEMNYLFCKRLNLVI